MDEMWIRDPGRKNSDPGSGMEKIRFRDKRPGTATLLKSLKISPSFKRQRIFKQEKRKRPFFSVVDLDPYPHGSALIVVDWIRIQEGKVDPRIKSGKVSCFEVLDV